MKDQKVGEGTYAVVYRGSFTLVSPFARVSLHRRLRPLLSSGRELATGRKIAIKKIKVGQFKDGLDMSAVREVKYLRELHHPNIIEVRVFSLSLALRMQRVAAPLHDTSSSASFLFLSLSVFQAPGCVFLKDESEPRPRVPRHRSRNDHQGTLARLSPRGHQELDGHDVSRSGILPQEFYPASSASVFFSSPPALGFLFSFLSF